MTSTFPRIAEILEGVIGDDAPAGEIPTLRLAEAALAPSAATMTRASALLADDDFRDAESSSLSLNDKVAEALITARGWTIETVPGGFAYVLPGHPLRSAGGKFGTDYVWALDDALTIALTAEALALGVEA